MAYSSSLTDKEWEIIAPLIPPKKPTCPPKMMNGVLYQLKNGRNGYDLPKDLPPYSTVFWHYKGWRKDGANKLPRPLADGVVYFNLVLNGMALGKY